MRRHAEATTSVLWSIRQNPPFVSNVSPANNDKIAYHEEDKELQLAFATYPFLNEVERSFREVRSIVQELCQAEAAVIAPSVEHYLSTLDPPDVTPGAPLPVVDVTAMIESIEKDSHIIDQRAPSPSKSFLHRFHSLSNRSPKSRSNSPSNISPSPEPTEDKGGAMSRSKSPFKLKDRRPGPKKYLTGTTRAHCYAESSDSMLICLYYL